jgi:hypothetical protein
MISFCFGLSNVIKATESININGGQNCHLLIWTGHYEYNNILAFLRLCEGLCLDCSFFMSHFTYFLDSLLKNHWIENAIESIQATHLKRGHGWADC